MPVHNRTVSGKGFLNTTAALLTGIGTMLAALVAVAILLIGEGKLFKGDADEPAGSGADGGDAVQFEGTFGYDGTEGFELDGETAIVRNPRRDPDVTFYTASRRLGVYNGAIVPWTQKNQPTRQDCAKLLETHGASTTFDIDTGARFCVRSSGGRTAFLAVISDGEEYQVTVWKQD
jgi:hypothetical protein